MAKPQLCTCITLFCTFLIRRFTTTTLKCQISRFVEDGNSRQQLLILFLNFDTVLENSTPNEVANIWRTKQDGIRRDKVWRRAISLFKWRFRSRRHRWCLSSTMLQGGWGEGKARGGRWEGKREEERLPPFPSSHSPTRAIYNHFYFHWNTQREPLHIVTFTYNLLEKQCERMRSGHEEHFFAFLFSGRHIWPSWGDSLFLIDQKTVSYLEGSEHCTQMNSKDKNQNQYTAHHIIL